MCNFEYSVAFFSQIMRLESEHVTSVSEIDPHNKKYDHILCFFYLRIDGHTLTLRLFRFKLIEQEHEMAK